MAYSKPIVDADTEISAAPKIIHSESIFVASNRPRLTNAAHGAT
jgi:hypothetical protein